MTNRWPHPVSKVGDGGRSVARDAERSMPSDAWSAKFEEFYGAAAMRIARHCYALTGNLAEFFTASPGNYFAG